MFRPSSLRSSSPPKRPPPATRCCLHLAAPASTNSSPMHPGERDSRSWSGQRREKRDDGECDFDSQGPCRRQGPRRASRNEQSHRHDSPGGCRRADRDWPWGNPVGPSAIAIDANQTGPSLQTPTGGVGLARLPWRQVVLYRFYRAYFPVPGHRGPLVAVPLSRDSWRQRDGSTAGFFQLSSTQSQRCIHPLPAEQSTSSSQLWALPGAALATELLVSPLRVSLISDDDQWRRGNGCGDGERHTLPLYHLLTWWPFCHHTPASTPITGGLYLWLPRPQADAQGTGTSCRRVTPGNGGTFGVSAPAGLDGSIS
jgi:hypothetical protein